ncbi:hypothetical protein QJQ45_021446, partial [Haematococcus lacustris]
MHSTKQKPGPSWVKWAIRKERSDAAARQNETQRQFDYVASAPAHEQLLTSKRAALQAAMQEQLDLGWEQHAARHAASWRQHAACSKLGPSPLQQVERLHEQQQQQQQQVVVHEQQCKDSSSSGWAAAAGCRCVAVQAAGSSKLQVAACCSACVLVHEQQQQHAV